VTDGSWKYKRIKLIAAQSGKCFNWDRTGCLNGARDCIVFEGEFRAFCAKCRLKLDAPKRIPKGVHTKKVLRSQITIDDYLGSRDE
jgi:hypothetical protein